jgi:endonuclease YncB( thermonuclease family)
MFGWRRKSDGFDWRAYVRTALVQRRERRRQRIEDMKAAAAERASDARDAVVAGSAAAGAAAMSGGSRLFGALGVLVRRALVAIELGILRLLAVPLALVRSGWRGAVEHPNAGSLATLIALISAIVVASAGWRGALAGAGIETIVPVVIGVISIVAAGAVLIARSGVLAAVSPGALRLSALGLLGVLGAGGAWAAYQRETWWPVAAAPQSLPAATAARPAASSTEASAKVAGRATPLSGQLVRIDRRVIRLEGIEAPERGQACIRNGRSWPCGESARTALSRLVRGKTVTCVVSARDTGTAAASGACTADGRDVADALVREGHVFSASTLFGGYASAEREARNASRGVWAGEALRPSEYRIKVWDEARKAAPEGCPIKGIGGGSSRTYLLPWSPGYVARSVRASRGDRWFCSEQDAIAAGYRLSLRG